jgi:hypothetical protein
MDAEKQSDSGNSEEMGNTDKVWCCLVLAKAAKPVKDELKARSWLDQSRKVLNISGNASAENICSFPLLVSSDLNYIREKQGIFAECWYYFDVANIFLPLTS